MMRNDDIYEGIDTLDEIYEPEEDEFLEEEKCCIVGIDLAQGESQTSIGWVPMPRKKPPDSVYQLAY